MKERIVVTSTGIISALGIGRDVHVHALRQGQSGLRYPTHLRTVHANEFLLGEIDRSDDSLSAILGLAAGDNGYTRTTLLALAALQGLVADAGTDVLRDAPLAIINASTVGGMCTVENVYMDFLSPHMAAANIKYIDTLDCAESTQHMAEYYGLKPMMATISTACSSSANALILGARMIRHGLVKRAICGGCDALSRFTLNGFNTLKNVDRTPCRPFDQNRFGLNLGEAAGYLLLESETSARERGAPVLAVLSGYCNSNDAYHPTAPSPKGEGAYRTMQGALAMAGIQPSEVGYINAHGTATINNDLAEGLAIQRLFTGLQPAFSSTKPFTGHTLAAAGAVEALFSIYSMQEHMVPPNLNFETPMEELNITPVTSLIENNESAHVLSNSFGFGGNNVALVFSKS